MTPDQIVRTIVNALLRRGTYGMTRKLAPVLILAVGIALALATHR